MNRLINYCVTCELGSLHVFDVPYIGNSPHAATPHRSSHHHLDSHTPISLMFSANFYPPDYGKCISPSLGSINASAKPPLQRHFADTHRDLLYVVSSRRFYFFL